MSVIGKFSFRASFLALCALILVACNSANPDSLGIVNTQAPLPPAQTTLTDSAADALETGDDIQPNAMVADNQAIASMPTTAMAATSLHIAPIIGATVETVRPLSRQMQALARSNNIAVQASSGGAHYIMRGYFSALAENGQTTVIYVWDVIDGSGRRLHRISGQEKKPGGRPDAWSGVTPDMMEAIATKTMANFQNWRASRAS